MAGQRGQRLEGPRSDKPLVREGSCHRTVANPGLNSTRNPASASTRFAYFALQPPNSISAVQALAGAVCAAIAHFGHFVIRWRREPPADTYLVS